MAEFFESMMKDPKLVDALFHRQQSADTIALMGPTSSAKSTVLTELLPPASNKLLGLNVGDTAQTTLIPPFLMLNSRLKENQVIIRCIPRQRELYPDFVDQIKFILAEVLYAERDELEDFEISEGIIRKVLDPIDRRFHAFEFAKHNKLIDSFADILNRMSEKIIEEPEPLAEAANARYKQIKGKDQRVKKYDAFEQLIDERFSTNLEEEQIIKKWYDELVEAVKNDLSHLWTYPDRLVLLGNPTSQDISELIGKLYSKTSACSLAFEEVQYMTCPSEAVKNEYIYLDDKYMDRTIKLSVRDSIGLTQSSQERDEISTNIDAVLANDSDAILFLCASDEQPIIYDMCVELLKEKTKKLDDKPLTICRTKADVRIRNIMVDNWRQEHGTNSVDPDKYDEYINRAFYTFCEILEQDREKAPENTKMEFLSLATDNTEKMNAHLDNELRNTRIIQILFDLSMRVDKAFDGGRPWLQSHSWVEYPIKVDGTLGDLGQTIAIAMVGKNHEQKKQYVQYIAQDGTYHGRSVNCFRSKLSYGEGHETNASIYLNFRLFLTNMVARWLRETLPIHDIMRDISIDFGNLEESPSAEIARREFLEKLEERLRKNWSSIIDQLARALSYNCLRKPFANAFNYKTWSDGFREALKVIEGKFSSVDYWNENIPKLLMFLADKQLQSMYIFD
ncbi:hypothetical protein IZU99_01360 [Oscillospiraceae bacterium CM]|nr:hypothetical protein IZU99_01360 [Oscillospiraceae bacterium CM]